MRRKPRRVELVPPVLGHREIFENIVEVHLDKGRQHEAIMQRCAPAREFVMLRLLPEACDQRAQQELLHDAHARMRWHFKRAQLKQSEATGRAIG